MTTTDRISQREEWVVASLLDNLDKPWGPNLCTALAQTDYWQNPIALRIARAIHQSRDNLTKTGISIRIDPADAMWLMHPSFMNGLPLDLAEYEAYDLCVYYRGKRLERLIGEALQKLKDHPEHGKCVAESLRSALEEFCV